MLQPSRMFATIFSLIVLALSIPCWAWGPGGHILITDQAIELLPPQMRPFYETNSRFLEALCILPDGWRETHKEEEAPNHYIDLELLGKPPFNDDREVLEKRLGKGQLLKNGVLPWTIQARYRKLVAALKAGDTEEILVQSGVLAHYIEDAHVPFHTTKDYDGKTPEQKGIHFRWEEELVQLWLRPAAPAKVDDVLKSAFEWIAASYARIDPILRADDKAREIAPAHNWKYFKTFWDETRPVLEEQLTRASEDLAGTWIAAWEEAGRPKLPDKIAPVFWGR